MADAAARREARRSKILKNSEDRMNRLLGLPVHGPDVASNIQSANNSAKDMDAHATVEDSSTSFRMSENPDLLNTGVRARTDRRPLGLNREQAAPAFSSLQDNSGANSDPTGPYQPAASSSTQRLADSETNSGTRLAEATPSSSGSSVGFDFPGRVPKATTTPNILKMMSIIRMTSIVFLACVVKWMIIFQVHYFILESIFVPFFLMELLLFFYQKKLFKDTLAPPQKSMMATALILAGLQPDVIATYHSVMAVVSILLEDTCLFVFSFIVLHIVI